MGNGKLNFTIYFSKALVGFNHQNLKKLVTNSQQKNAALKVTGYIYFEEGYFIQYIEAYDEKVLRDLFTEIKLDERHTVIQSFTSSSDINRRFQDWQMHWIEKEQILDLKIENAMLNYMKWLSKDDDILKFNSVTVWSLVDTLAFSKNKLENFRKLR